MTRKEQVLQALRDLPDDTSFDDAIARLALLASIEKGIAQADAGELLSHEAVKERMAPWLK
jgi:predicted transcriptional regulator